MRLISCHVEGFGAIKCQDFTFDNSPAVFIFENGYGKSTLCAFITAMLYGFDTAKSNSQKFEDRVHYYPFDGGRFGGSLTLTHEARIYRIERFFDKKSQTKDTFSLYIDDKPAAFDGESIGEELLGVDRESFLRIVLMDSRDAYLGSTDGINERLGKFSGGEGDLAVKAALARLDAEAKKLKVRGGGGEINRLSTEIARLRDRIENLNTIEGSLDTLYKKREALLARCAELKTEQKSYRERSVLKEKRAAYKRLLQEKAEIEERLEELSKLYPSGLPRPHDIGALADIKSEIARLESLVAETKKSEATAEREARLSSAFRTGAPTDEELDEHRQSFAEIGEVEEELSALIDSADGAGRKRLPLLISGGALIAAAIGLAFVNIIASAVAGAIGMALMLSTLFIKSEGGASHIAELNAKKARLTKKIEIFLSKNGYFSTGVAALDFAALEADVKAYNIIKKENEERDERLEDLGKHLRMASLTHEYLVKRFAPGGQDAPNATDIIYADRREYDELVSRRERTMREIADYVAAFGRGEELLLVNDEADAPIDPTLTLSGVEREILNVEADIAACEDRLQEKEGALLDLTRLKETEADAIERLSIITKTQEYLKRADDRMISRYLSPIKERFLEYGASVADYIGEKFSMDRDLNLYFEAHGERRTEKHLSQGQHAIVALCMRLSIAEVIFGKDNTLLLLDDPFTALDEKHFKNVSSLIKKLSKTTQIVYFTCHNSRNV